MYVHVFSKQIFVIDFQFRKSYTILSTGNLP